MRITAPVDTGLSVPPLTETVTVNACVVVMLKEDGVTVTVGVAVATFTAEDAPMAVLYAEELAQSGV